MRESEVVQSCPTLHNPMDCSLPGSSVHGIFPGKSTGVDCHYWSIIALQCCISFYCTAKLIRPYIYIHPLTFGLPSYSGHPSALSTVHCAVRYVLIIYFICNINMCQCVHVSILISQFLPPFPSLPRTPCPNVHSVCLCFCSCSGNRLICIIFLDSIYMC